MNPYKREDLEAWNLGVGFESLRARHVLNDLRRAAAKKDQHTPAEGKFLLLPWHMPSEMLELGILKRDGDSISVDKGLRALLDGFSEFLATQTDEVAKD